ncbi:MAG: hypothetical protein AAFU49_02040 [Pseudomonadota bacterium]
MSKSMMDPLSTMTGANAELFKLWISFFPVAPAFGVEWRFAQMMPMGTGFDTMPGMAAFTEAAKPEAKPAKPAPKAKPAKKAAAKPAPAVAPEPVAEADPVVVALKPKQPEPVVEPVVEAVVDTPVETPAEAPVDAAVEADLVKPATLFDEAPAEVDDLQMIKGIGPGLESKLNALGIYRLDQMAGFSEQDLQWIDENLTTFKGRCFRDDWVGQAKGLIA